MPEETSAPAPAPAAEPAPQPSSGSSSGDNVIGAICYISIIGVILLFAKKDSAFVQFHAKQATALFIGQVIWWFVAVILAFVPVIGWLISMLGWIAFLVAAIVGFVKAYGGEKYKMPVVGDLAEKINI